MFKKSFTLIEMLVVVSIIAILATIVIVAVQRSSLNARDGRRKADIKTLKNAIEQYANNNRGLYPTTAPTEGSAQLLSTLLSPYLNPIPNDPAPQSTSYTNYWYYSPTTNSYGLRVQFEELTFGTVKYCKTGVNMVATWWSSAPTCDL